MKTLPLIRGQDQAERAGGRGPVEVVITKNGRPAAVLVSPSEHESWKETIAIHRDPAFMSEIKAGLAALKSKKAKLYTLEELLNPGG